MRRHKRFGQNTGASLAHASTHSLLPSCHALLQQMTVQAKLTKKGTVTGGTTAKRAPAGGRKTFRCASHPPALSWAPACVVHALHTRLAIKSGWGAGRGVGCIVLFAGSDGWALSVQCIIQCDMCHPFPGRPAVSVRAGGAAPASPSCLPGTAQTATVSLVRRRAAASATLFPPAGH